MKKNNQAYDPSLRNKKSSALFWGAKVGLNLNNEHYSNDTEDRQSREGYFGTELNLYNVGDVDLYFQIMAYPGITAPDGWPADDASEMDYLFQTGIGWEW